MNRWRTAIVISAGVVFGLVAWMTMGASLHEPSLALENVEASVLAPNFSVADKMPTPERIRIELGQISGSDMLEIGPDLRSEYDSVWSSVA